MRCSRRRVRLEFPAELVTVEGGGVIRPPDGGAVQPCDARRTRTRRRGLSRRCRRRQGRTRRRRQGSARRLDGPAQGRDARSPGGHAPRGRDRRAKVGACLRVRYAPARRDRRRVTGVGHRARRRRRRRRARRVGARRGWTRRGWTPIIGRGGRSCRGSRQHAHQPQTCARDGGRQLSPHRKPRWP
jgi:hypothetical protein